MKKVIIELDNILPLQLVLPPQPKDSAFTVHHDSNSWCTSPLYLKNPLTVAQILGDLATHGFGGYSLVSAVGVNTPSGDAIIFSGSACPIIERNKMPMAPAIGSTKLEKETITVWDLIAQAIAKNEPLFPNQDKNSLEHFASDQTVYLFKTAVQLNSSKSGTMDSLVIESGIVSVIVHEPVPESLVNSTKPVLKCSIDSKVEWKLSDVLNNPLLNIDVIQPLEIN